MLMEVREQHHIAIEQRRQLLLAGQQPLLGQGSCVEKATTDEALHALEGDVRAAPWIHWKMGVEGSELDSG